MTHCFFFLLFFVCSLFVATSFAFSAREESRFFLNPAGEVGKFREWLLLALFHTHTRTHTVDVTVYVSVLFFRCGCVGLHVKSKSFSALRESVCEVEIMD
jgi:hypothetical protein